MLGSVDVVAVIGVKDLEAAKKFYGETLGLAVDKEAQDGGIFYRSGSNKLFVYATQFGGTNQATAAAWSVEDVAAVVNELKDKGVAFEHYDNIPGATLEGDVHVMGTLKAAWFKDPSGNILNIVSGM